MLQTNGISEAILCSSLISLSTLTPMLDTVQPYIAVALFNYMDQVKYQHGEVITCQVWRGVKILIRWNLIPYFIINVITPPPPPPPPPPHPHPHPTPRIRHFNQVADVKVACYVLEILVFFTRLLPYRIIRVSVPCICKRCECEPGPFSVSAEVLATDSTRPSVGTLLLTNLIMISSEFSGF